MQSASSALTKSRHNLQCHRGWYCKASNNCRPIATTEFGKREYISWHGEPIKQVLRRRTSASEREPVDLEKWSAERVQANQSRPYTSPGTSLIWPEQGLVGVILQVPTRQLLDRGQYRSCQSDATHRNQIHADREGSSSSEYIVVKSIVLEPDHTPGTTCE